ncbi:MAG: hypothetical protein IKJ99_02890 [Oscillospiraceae bacterium]|nr:hypothetical protein [Oscillospiraceae bacterium]
MAIVKCALGVPSKSTHEWFDGVNQHIYCYGHIGKDLKPVPECLTCPNHVYKAEEDVAKWKAATAPGRTEIYNLLLDQKCPAWLYDNFNALQTADYLMSRGVTIQKTGNWILRCEHRWCFPGEVEEVFHLECSECHRKVWDISQSDAMMCNWEKLIESFPYCHCGAKMCHLCEEESIEKEGEQW